MPPAAISRSSTYLPKICGNIVVGMLGASVLGGAQLGCAPEPAERWVALRLHVPPLCPEPNRPRYPVDITALGHYPPSAQSSAVLADARAEFAFPEATLGFTARGADGAWQGITERVDQEAGVDLLLWPSGSACPLSPAGQAPYPGASGGHALGYSEGRTRLLLAGGSGDQTSAVGTVLVDLGTGQVTPASADSALSEPRAFATVTEFGDDFLIAGGFDPITRPGAASASAEVFDADIGRVQAPAIPLKRARARHGALRLENGDTLLAGGVGANGELESSLEAVSPAARTSTLFGLATLRAGRVQPTLLRLDDGRIVVAGGEYFDALGHPHPVALLEWLTEDAARFAVPPPLEFSARFDRAYVALPGSSILAVGGCEDRPPDADEDCSACRLGCPPRDGWDAEWISPEGVATKWTLDVPAPSPVLIASANGSSLLVAGGVLYAFNPWRGRFEPAPTQPEWLPETGASRTHAIDAGAFVWLSLNPVPQLAGYRFTVKSRYAADTDLLASARTDDVDSPLHLVPDRAPTLDDGALSAGFERDHAGAPILRLGYGWVVIPDARYDAFELEIVIDSGPAPALRVGRTELGTPACPWWPPRIDQTSRERLRVVRSGEAVRLLRQGSETTCPVETGSLDIALRAGGSGEARVSQLTMRRTADRD